MIGVPNMISRLGRSSSNITPSVKAITGWIPDMGTALEAPTIDIPLTNSRRAMGYPMIPNKTIQPMDSRDKDLMSSKFRIRANPPTITTPLSTVSRAAVGAGTF